MFVKHGLMSEMGPQGDLGSTSTPGGDRTLGASATVSDDLQTRY